MYTCSDPYQQNLLQLHHRRVYYMILAGAILFLLFGVRDYFLVPELFSEFFVYRITVCALGCLLFLLNFYDRQGKYAFILGFAGYLLIGLVINRMIIRMGGVGSPYYVGLIVVITTYTAIAPLTMLQTLSSGFTLVVLYVLSILFFSPQLPGDSTFLLNNVFFMVCFTLIVAIQSRTETLARKREFSLRMQEEETAQELEQHAKHLEVEVKQRTEQQRASEERYRLLFENIADDVILVNEQGDILHANPPFFSHMQTKPSANRSLFDFIRHEDRVRDELLTGLARDGIVSNYQINMVTASGKAIEAEISGARLIRKDTVLGLQLIIRNISRRKKLERDLIESLQTVQKTESATILALAKLSEYRDVTPGKHLERIREYCRILALALSRRDEYRHYITEPYINDLYHAAILHDIGKVGIPDKILFKSGSLSPEEMEITRRHAIFGGDVIKAMEGQTSSSGFLAMAKSIAYFHHEKWDGSGYPHGLKEQEIPLTSRIIALADSYEAMTTSTLYGKTYSHDEAVQLILRDAGHHFDPMVVDAFIMQQEEFNRIRQDLAEK
ncbi:MAG: HD domain-containing protein [Desulfobulbaceae bacterium]|nr:HD domain-containing protein [Desulfobulbaceae bacterium]